MDVLVQKPLGMKQSLFILFFVCAGIASAQETTTLPMQIGVHAGIRSGVNISEIPSGWKTGIAFGSLPDLGLTAIVPISAEYALSALVDIGVMSTSYRTKPFYSPTDSNTVITQNNYLSFAPSVLFRFGYLGLNMGIPLSSTRSASDETVSGTSFVNAQQASALNNELSMLFELRLGGYFPLIRDEEGVLSAFALLSYQLNGSYSSFNKVQDVVYPAGDGTGVVTDTHNPRTLSLTIGMRYVFDWSKTTEE